MLGVFAKANLPGTLVRARPASPPRPGETIVEVSVVQMRGQDESARFAAALENQDACASVCAIGEEAALVAVEKLGPVDADEPMTPPMEFDQALLASIELRKAQDAAKAAQAQQLAQQVAPASPSDLVLGQWRKRKAKTLVYTPRAPKKQFATRPRAADALGGRKINWESDSETDDETPARVESPLLGGKKINWSDSDSDEE